MRGNHGLKLGTNQVQIQELSAITESVVRMRNTVSEKMDMQSQDKRAH